MVGSCAGIAWCQATNSADVTGTGGNAVEAGSVIGRLPTAQNETPEAANVLRFGREARQVEGTAHRSANHQIRREPSPHACKGPIGGLATSHVNSAMPNFVVQEICGQIQPGRLTRFGKSGSAFPRCEWWTADSRWHKSPVWDLT
jgi:hypothetical protein